MLSRMCRNSANKWRGCGRSVVFSQTASNTTSLGVSIDDYEKMADDYIPPLMYRNESGMRHMRPLVTPEYGVEILHDPLWNKGTAFTMEERDRLGLRGLLPPQVRTIEEQVARIQNHLAKEPTPEDKNMYLQDLANRNETLYYRTLVENIEEMAPLVYTPTVGVVCQQFGNQFRRTRGMFISKYDRGHMNTMMHNWPSDDVRLSVFSVSFYFYVVMMAILSVLI
jgi:hypothetical protein